MPLFLELLRERTQGEPERMRRALAGLRRYQEAQRRPVPAPMPVLAEALGATVRDYGGSGAPILFVPSLINPPTILDLPGRSLLRWLATRGHRPLLLDWGWPSEERRRLSITGHVEQILVPLIDALGAPPALAGYCLGGTMALAAARLRPPPRLALIATPWRFAGFPEPARASLASLWAGSEAGARALGLLPMEVLQSAFWRLDPERTVAKFEHLATLLPGSADAQAFVTLEDWANDGPPLGVAAARELFEHFLAADLPGHRRWMVGGEAVDPASLPCPLLDIISLSDRIVPAASAVGVGTRMELGSGHVGMIVGSRGSDMLWEPLSAWLGEG